MPLFDDSIELVDKNGVVRLRAMINDDNTPWFSLNDSLGRERLVLTVNHEGNGSIGLRDADGNAEVSVGISSSLGSGMILQNGNNGVFLGIQMKGKDARLFLHTPKGVDVWPAESRCEEDVEGDSRA
jgi:hypothetical protein